MPTFYLQRRGTAYPSDSHHQGGFLRAGGEAGSKPQPAPGLTLTPAVVSLGPEGGQEYFWLAESL